MTNANYESRRFEFRGENNTEYYDGDLELLSTRDVDIRIEKSLAGEYGIYKETSRVGLAFRRSWSHIRNDKTNLTVFWFLRRGQITISQPGGRYVVNPDECAVTRSDKALYMELTPDADGVMEVMHVVVPSHKLYAVLGDNVELGRPFPTSTGDLFLAERVFSLLFEQDDQVDPATAEQLVDTLLADVGRTIAGLSDNGTRRCSIADRRVADITRYINQHFANPDLNAKMVADSCGISLRYLCHVLKKSDLSFSHLVWERRMTTAHDWLKDAKMQHHSISEIAYLVGFKSSAHFSRMFKMRYGVAPREFRNSELEAASGTAEIDDTVN
ncbi:AraC family transcriptional regulator [Stakelama tenebrarum]|uniref:AraC family transcriptional regulator n=1 Tax=Stakelama tenebrarum TaxID=2711215 RepID=A0A6G6Y777_9SPHN|nr:AraC family transcriptional regulator [Sphingosinithalassobacter tenebrarum]QIG80775.1 AraC family transcriptional regulator [Sphingosinithalassobacter tenebrarum]